MNKLVLSSYSQCVREQASTASLPLLLLAFRQINSLSLASQSRLHSTQTHLSGYMEAAAAANACFCPVVPLQWGRADRWFSVSASISLSIEQTGSPTTHLPCWWTNTLFLYLHLPLWLIEQAGSSVSPPSSCTHAEFSLQTTSMANIGCGRDVSFPWKSKRQLLSLSVCRFFCLCLPNSVFAPVGGSHHTNRTNGKMKSGIWNCVLKGEINGVFE